MSKTTHVLFQMESPQEKKSEALQLAKQTHSEHCVQSQGQRGGKCILAQMCISTSQPHSPSMWVLLWSTWIKSIQDRSHVFCSIFPSSHNLRRLVHSPYAIAYLLLCGSAMLAFVTVPGSPFPSRYWLFSTLWEKSHITAYKSASREPGLNPFWFPQSSVVPQNQPIRDQLYEPRQVPKFQGAHIPHKECLIIGKQPKFHLKYLTQCNYFS